MSFDASAFYKVEHSSYRCQGDIYSASDFQPSAIPTSSYPFWMLLTRTCQLYENDSTGRSVKIPYLVFCAVQKMPVWMAASQSSKSKKNQLKNIIHEKEDFLAFMPKGGELDSHLIVDFNMVYSVAFEKTPPSSAKKVELSHPFSEKIMQRFSRWYYTVGFDDEAIKDNRFIDALVLELNDASL